jgi:hypothetical protein
MNERDGLQDGEDQREPTNPLLCQRASEVHFREETVLAAYSIAPPLAVNMFRVKRMR